MGDYVTYEQAVKLKEFGFKYPCNHYYSSDSGLLHEETENDQTNYIHCNSKYLISAPTLSQAQKWLREVKKMIVLVTCNLDYEDGHEWYWFVDMDELPAEPETKCDTYEEALSAGIDVALNWLKKQ